MTIPEAAHGNLRQTAQSLLGLQLQPPQLEAFKRYAAELTAWNARFNLSAITDPSEIEVKHFLDSLTCLKAMGPNPVGRVVDVGTGAGFPGLCLKIACPRLQMTLIESVAKKVEFCRHMVRLLGLEAVTVLHGRAEGIARIADHREGYDWALARAVANLPVLVEFLLPFLKIGGRAVAHKGDTAPAEVSSAGAALAVLGGEVRQLVPIELPQVAETRYLVIIEKVSATPAKYPRRPGIPKKRPLTRA